MKKIFNNSLFTFILGSIIFCSIGVYASSTYYANQIRYIKSNSEEVTLDSALNELYTSASIESYTPSGHVTPTTSEQVLQTSGKKVTSNIIVDPIPSNYKDMESVTLWVAAISGSNSLGQGEVVIRDFSTWFKYFKVLSNEARNNYSQYCKTYSWSGTQRKMIEISLNTQYNVNSSVDGYGFQTARSITASTTANTEAICDMKVLLYN